jgi:hypothetical protein
MRHSCIARNLPSADAETIARTRLRVTKSQDSLTRTLNYNVNYARGSSSENAVVHKYSLYNDIPNSVKCRTTTVNAKQ